MVKQIVRDIFFLGQKSEPATKADLQIGIDLRDALEANRERCVGMAANMIGIKKKVIIVNMGLIDVVMFNPVIIKRIHPIRQKRDAFHWMGYARQQDMKILKWNIWI